MSFLYFRNLYFSNTKGRTGPSHFFFLYYFWRIFLNFSIWISPRHKGDPDTRHFFFLYFIKWISLFYELWFLQHKSESRTPALFFSIVLQSNCPWFRFFFSPRQKGKTDTRIFFILLGIFFIFNCHHPI